MFEEVAISMAKYASLWYLRNNIKNIAVVFEWYFLKKWKYYKRNRIS